MNDEVKKEGLVSTSSFIVPTSALPLPTPDPRHPSPTKVVRIIARLNVGGPARHVVWLTEGLRGGRGAEWETLLVTGTVPQGEDDMSYFAAAAHVEPLIIPEMSREISAKDALTIWKLFRLFLRERPDLVHTHTAKAGTVGRLAGLLYRWLVPSALLGRPRPCRFVHTYHGHIFHSYYGKLKTRVFLIIEKILARAVTDRIVVLSAQQRREIHVEFGVGRDEQFTIIPLGLDVKAFAGWRERRHIMRDELGASERDVLVGIVGRLTEIKHHEMFLKVVALYQEKFLSGKANASAIEGSERRVRFVVVGDGHLREKLETQARALGLGASVLTFQGSRDDPENFYPALDVVALTSRNEGTPLTLIEAMANARPVIATAVGGVVDLLGASSQAAQDAGDSTFVAGERSDAEDLSGAYNLCERGVLVRPNDAAGFCVGLARLVEDEKLREELGERGLRFVEQHYSKDRLLADIEKLYRNLVHEERAGVRGQESGDGKSKSEVGTMNDEVKTFFLDFIIHRSSFIISSLSPDPCPPSPAFKKGRLTV